MAKSLELRQQLHPAWKRATWFGQRVLWCVMAAVITLAVVGIFGDGPLADASATVRGDGQETTVRYDRFTRRTATESLVIEVSAASAGDSVTLSLDREFVSAIDIERLTPEPESAMLDAGGGLTLSWNVPDWSRPVRIGLTYVPQRWGTLRARLRVDAGTEQHVSFRQYVFP